MRISTAGNCLTIQAPGRIDFTGGFSDLPGIREKIVCHHVSASIDRYVRVLLGDSTRQSLRSKAFIDITQASRQYIRATNELFRTNFTSNMRIVSSIPSNSGLGGSGSLAVALTRVAFFERYDRRFSREDIAEAAVQLEVVAGTFGGSQDQWAAALGGVNQLTFSNENVAVTSLICSPSQMRNLETGITLVKLPGRRSSAELTTAVAERFKQGNVRVRRAIENLNGLASPLAAAIKNADMKSLRAYTAEVGRLQRELDARIFGAGAQEIIQYLARRNIKGIKALGAGGAGSCLLVIAPHQEIRRAVRAFTEQVEILDVRLSMIGVNAKSHPFRGEVVNHKLAG
jgi:D-glycero-alpha-D-manno-heptose-7-phosphate kinase